MKAADWLKSQGIRDFLPGIGAYSIVNIDGMTLTLKRGSMELGKFSSSGVDPRCVLNDIRKDIQRLWVH